MIRNRLQRRFKIIQLAVRLVRIYRKVRRFNRQGAPAQLVDEQFALAGRLIRETCYQLWGVVVKAGQFLSLRQELFPASFTKELQGLQEEVPPADSSVILASVERELGAALETVFTVFHSEPIASASISQVHKAVLISGETVAVKMLRPDIERLAKVDLSTLGKVVRVVQRIPGVGAKMDYVALHKEFEETITRELDMQAESCHMARFAEEVGGDERIVIPKVFGEHTTQRMLVMEYIEGANIRDADRLDEWGVDKAAVRDALLDVYLKQILVNGFIHLDPHPGNLAILPDGRLALLDFGMIDELDGEEMAAFRKLLQYAAFRNVAGIAEVLQQLGYLRSDADPADFATRVGPLLGRFNVNLLHVLWEYKGFQLQAKYMLLVRCLGLLKTVLNELTPEEDDWVGELSEHVMPVLMSSP